MRNAKLVTIASALILVGIVFVSGMYVGYERRPYIERVIGVSNQQWGVKNGDPVDFDPFWKAWNILEKTYVAKNEINRQKLVWGAIQGMVSAVGDPYTVFMPPSESSIFQEDISGAFEGIGAEIGIRSRALVVISPLEGSPAKLAGLKAGDYILKIDGEDTTNITVEEAVTKIRGKGGTVVTLTIFREGEDTAKEISITRAKIEIPVIDTEINGDVFIIRLYQFSANSPDLFETAIREFVGSGKNKLILDLRNNPGGYLDAAVDIASWFIPRDEVVLIERVRGEEPREYRSRGYAEIRDLKMAVRVDRGSGSASEILAGALQDDSIATIIGVTAFGKGSVQEVVDVTGDTTLKITIARWFTPNDVSITEVGLVPHIAIDPEEAAAAEEKGVVDFTLDRAMQFITTGT
ncbi:MAG: S41 family peptidase [Patescibacteria group bacterium]